MNLADAGAAAALAHYYCAKQDHQTAYRFARQARSQGIETPELLLDLAVSAWYSGDKAVEIGREACEALAFSREAPKEIRDLARQKTYFYTQEIGSLLPSSRAVPINFNSPPGWFAHNASITRQGDLLFLAQRCINYWIDQDGSHTSEWTPEGSRTFLCRVDPDSLVDEPLCELRSDIPGFEDLRLFSWKGDLWGIATGIDAELMHEQWLVKIERLSDCKGRSLHYGDWRRSEKNWMPLVDGDKLRFIYAVAPTIVLDQDAAHLSLDRPAIDGAHLRGSSQAIAFDGGWLAVVHAITRQEGWAKYHHRFAWWDRSFCLKRLSMPFTFQTETTLPSRRGYQYVMGLCRHPDEERLLISYQVDECRPWIGAFAAGDLAAVLLELKHG